MCESVHHRSRSDIVTELKESARIITDPNFTMFMIINSNMVLLHRKERNAVLNNNIVAGSEWTMTGVICLVMVSEIDLLSCFAVNYPLDKRKNLPRLSRIMHPLNYKIGVLGWILKRMFHKISGPARDPLASN